MGIGLGLEDLCLKRVSLGAIVDCPNINNFFGLNLQLHSDSQFGLPHVALLAGEAGAKNGFSDFATPKASYLQKHERLLPQEA